MRAPGALALSSPLDSLTVAWDAAAWEDPDKVPPLLLGSVLPAFRTTPICRVESGRVLRSATASGQSTDCHVAGSCSLIGFHRPRRHHRCGQGPPNISKVSWVVLEWFRGGLRAVRMRDGARKPSRYVLSHLREAFLCVSDAANVSFATYFITAVHTSHHIFSPTPLPEPNRH